MQCPALNRTIILPPSKTQGTVKRTDRKNAKAGRKGDKQHRYLLGMAQPMQSQFIAAVAACKGPTVG